MMAKGKRKRRKVRHETRRDPGDSSQPIAIRPGQQHKTKVWFRAPLDMNEHYQVSRCLDDLEHNQLIRLGGALGLYHPNLKKMGILPDEMVSAWLRKEDNVLGTSGEPSWYSLCEALREISQPGIAQKIEKEIQYQKARESRKTARVLRHYGRLWNQYTSPTYYWDYHPKMLIVFMLALIALIAGSVMISLPYIRTSLDRAKVSKAKTLPYITQAFMGRNKELDELINLLEFDQMHTRIVSLTGPPGFGKSALAIKIGHHFALQRLAVLYVDMHDSTDMRGVAEKVLEGNGITTKNATPKRMYRWFRDRNEHTILILDNCDDVLYKSKDEFQHAVQQILKSSQLVKVLLTSRHKVVWVDDAYEYTLNELALDFSKKLLQSIVTRTTLDDTSTETLANLTGNVPLALKVVGSLLNKPDPPSPQTIINELEREPMETLSPQRLPQHQQVYASIRVSFRYLKEDIQYCGQVLAHFPGSFDQQSASAILNGYNWTRYQKHPSNCLSTLSERSLLDYSEKFNQYKFHKLLKDFFLFCSQSKGWKESIHKQFEHLFQHHFSWVLTSVVKEFEHSSYANALKHFDSHKHNIQHFVNHVVDYVRKYGCQANASVEAVLKGYTSQLFMCRFSKSELQILAANMTEIIESFALSHCHSVSFCSDFGWLFVAYTEFLTNWADLVNGQLNNSNAYADPLHILSSRWPHVETLISKVNNTSSRVNSQYIKFYTKLGDLYSINGKHDDYRRCHAKILAKGHQLQRCDPENCDYLSIANSYYNAHEYEKCIEFFQLAMNTLLDMTPFDKTVILSKIYNAFKQNGQNEQANQTMQEIINEIYHLKDPLHTLQEANTLTEVYLLLEDKQRPEASIILDRIIIMLMKDQKSPYLTQMSSFLMKSFYKRKDYVNAFKYGEIVTEALRVSGHEKTQLYGETLAYLSLIKLWGGNYSDGIKYLNNATKLINELPHGGAHDTIFIECAFLYWIEWRCLHIVYFYMIMSAEQEYLQSHSKYYSESHIYSAPSTSTDLSISNSQMTNWYGSFFTYLWAEDAFIWVKSIVYAVIPYAIYYLIILISLFLVCLPCFACCCATCLGCCICSCINFWFQIFILAWFLVIPVIVIPVPMIYFIGDVHLTLVYIIFLFTFWLCQLCIYVVRKEILQ